MIKNYLFLLLIFCWSFTISHAQQTDFTRLTLENCIEIALENNLDLMRSQLDLITAEIGLLESQGRRIPSLNAGASSGFNWGRNINPATNLFETNRIGRINLSANSSVPLFAGGQISSVIKQAVIDVETGQLNVKASENNISLNVINLFLNVVFTKERIKIADTQLQTLREQLLRTEKLVTAGTLPISDKLDLESQTATGELDLVNAQNQLRISKLNLAQAMQVPFSEKFDIVTPELSAEDYDISESSVDFIFEKAIGFLPEIRASELRLRSTGYGVKAAKGAFFPTLSLGGNAFSNYVDLPIFPNPEVLPFATQVQNNFAYSGLLNLSIPLFTNFANTGRYQRAKVQRKLAEINKTSTYNKVRQDIETAYNSAYAARQSYLSSQKRILALQESFRMAQQRFNSGAINSVDFQVAQNQYFNAQADLINAKFEYIFRVKVLDFYLGNPLKL
jgi:outer membrane protein